jgi:hypothetical protein
VQYQQEVTLAIWTETALQQPLLRGKALFADLVAGGELRFDGRMHRINHFAATLLLVPCACSRPAPVEQPESSPPPRASAIAAPSASAFGGGISAYGATHWTVTIEPARGADSASVAALSPLRSSFLRCYTEGRRVSVTERVRIELQITISATGDVMTSAGAVGRPANEDDIGKCASKVVQSAEFPAAARGTSFGVAVTLSP